jgi:hypothetical protein
MCHLDGAGASPPPQFFVKPGCFWRRLVQASANQLAAGASKLGGRGGELSLGRRDFGRVGSF